MPTAEFFTRLGLFVRKDFLEQELCTRCCREIDEAAQAKAIIAGPNETGVVDETLRKVKWAAVPATTVSLVETRLLALIPTLQRHFNVTLTGFQPLDFLTYQEGDFNRCHLPPAALDRSERWRRTPIVEDLSRSMASSMIHDG